MPFLNYRPYPLAVRTRQISVLAIGLALLATAVGAYIGFTRHFDKTLSAGTKTTGTVTRLIQPARWNPIDSGQIAVSYDLNDVQHHARIWLDNDLSGFHVGEQLPVWVRGSHVRTRDDVNGPAPLALTLFITALTGLCLSLYGGVRLIGRSSYPPQPRDGGGRIPLRAFRLNRRKAYLDLLPGQVSLFLPAYFGRRLLELPTAGAAFAMDDLGAPPIEQMSGGQDDDVYFREAIVIPYFPTASVLRGPNMVILLPAPVRMPALRRLMMFNQNISLPFGYRQSRSEEGVWLDGVELAVADPASARIALMNAGLMEESPSKWLAAHRELEHDAAEIEVIRADVAYVRRFGRVDGVLSGVGLVSLIAAKVTHHFALAIAAFVAIGAQLLLPFIARLVGRQRKTRVEEPANV
jgi:hypothetical protein